MFLISPRTLRYDERRKEQRKRGRKRRETMTTRRDENDDDDDLARLLSGPDQPASSFSVFYCGETHRLPRHESTRRMRSDGKRRHESDELLKNHHLSDENAA